MADHEAAHAEQEQSLVMIFCYVESCQKLLQYLSKGFTFVVDEALLQFEHDAVFACDQHLYHSLRPFYVDWGCGIHLIFGVEVLDFIDRGDQILETHHLQVVLTHVRIQFSLFLFLLFGLRGLPRVHLSPLLLQGLLVYLALFHNELQYSRQPFDDPVGSILQKTTSYVMLGTAFQV